MKIVVIGGVAAGTSAAAKARRNSEDSEIVIYERGGYISYSGCGMPYYIGGEVEDEAELTPRGPAFFKTKYNVDVYLHHEVTKIDPKRKKLKILKKETGEFIEDRFDKLVIATGARSVMPEADKADRENVFMLRTIEDMQKIKAFADKTKPGSAAIIGTGFVGMEMCENLSGLGIFVTLIEKMPEIMPWLDTDMAPYLKKHLLEKGIQLKTGAIVRRIEKEKVILDDGEIKAGLVIVSAGVKPDTVLAEKAGIALGGSGAIRVDDRMRTNLTDIYACGDCIEVYNCITGEPIYRPLGSTANKTGRIAGDSLSGGDLAFRGILGTGIFKIFDLTVARTGLSEGEARVRGIETAVCHNIKPSRPEYLKGRELVIKAVADKKDGRLLGAQIVGFEGVDKRIDVIATAITFGAKAADLFHLDLAYAPPYATTKDPVHYTGMMLENAIHRGRPLMEPHELKTLIESGSKVIVIDARARSQYEKGHVKKAQNIPLADLRKQADMLERDAVIVTYCNKGVTGNAAQNLLKNKGFERVFNLSGGYRNYSINYPEDVRMEEEDG